MADRHDHDPEDVIRESDSRPQIVTDKTGFRTLTPNLRTRLFARLDVVWIRFGADFAREFDQGRGFLWLPVGVVIGIVVYFSLPREPSLVALALAFIGVVWLARRMRADPIGFAALSFAAAIAAGLVLAKARTDRVSAPRLDRERTLTVVGWIETLDPAKRGLRMTLRVASMVGVSSEKTPRRVRISVRGDGADRFRPGDGVSLRARLRPPRGPVMPGGYDFARAQFFDRIGATGFAFGAPQPAELGPQPIGLRIKTVVNRVRSNLSVRIREVLAGDTGAVASALIVGWRRAISNETEEALRKAGLAHILAISGLHMALVAGSVYWTIRAVLALFPTIALRWPIRKWAAAVALAVGALYLLLSGASVATQRAFIMIAVVFVAVLRDRPALTMRSIAVAALIVMLIAPETVVGPSFQMSFAAAMSLIAMYEWIMSRQSRVVTTSASAGWLLLRPIWRYLLGLMMTSVVAGLATAPFAALHFHRIAPYGLIANLAAMPIVGVLVMPAGVLSILAVPFGLDPVTLSAMGWGIDRITTIPEFVAGITPAATSVTGSIPTVAVVTLTAGMLWLALWQTRLRLFGLAAIVIGLALAQTGSRPDILISADGRLVAARGEGGRLSLAGKSRSRLTRGNWLRADGDPRAINDPRLKEGSRCDRFGCILTGRSRTTDDRPIRVAIVYQPLAFEEDCRIADIVVTDRTPPAACERTAAVFDRASLTRTGAIAIRLDPSRPNGIARITTALPRLRRPWHPPLSPRQ